MSIVSRPLPVALKERAHAGCPRCGTPAAPSSDSTMTLAWYECACGEEWSCRLRNGVPGIAVVGEFAVMSRQMMHAA
jgi:hypothetical protein